MHWAKVRLSKADFRPEFRLSGRQWTCPQQREGLHSGKEKKGAVGAMGESSGEISFGISPSREFTFAALPSANDRENCLDIGRGGSVGEYLWSRRGALRPVSSRTAKKLRTGAG